MRLYIDGVEVENTRTNDQPLKVDASDTYIGWSGHYGHDKFDGIIDEVRIYNKAFTEAEIFELYKESVDLSEALYSPVTGHWHHDMKIYCHLTDTNDLSLVSVK